MYRNWAKICELGHTSRSLMVAMMNVDPDSKLGRKLQKGFPEYYSETELPRKTSLSALYFPDDPYKRFLYGVAEGTLKIPVLFFAKRNKENSFRQRLPYLPETIREDARIGDVVEWEGGSYVVVENGNIWDARFSMVPLECIDPSL